MTVHPMSKMAREAREATFAHRIVMAMVRATDEARVAAPEFRAQRRREVIEVTVAGATVPEIKAWMEAAHGVTFPASASRAKVVAAMMAIIG